MKVLVACEYSGTVRDAFARKGHYAVSCDLLDSESPGMHYKGDIFDILNYWKWDLIIAHPPCTYLCVAGNRYYSNSPERKQAQEWTLNLWNSCLNSCNKVCFENPVSTLKLTVKPSYIQPYQFGHLEQKKTGLYLHNLPNLIQTNNVYSRMMQLDRKERERIFYMAPSKNRGKLRSKFYIGIADAMAEQWSF